MTGPTGTNRLVDAPTRTLASVAAAGIIAWTALEFALRRGVVALLADPLGNSTGADALVMVVAIPIVAAVIAWIGFRAGIDRVDWEYDLTLRTVGAGLVGILAYFVVFIGIALVLVVVLVTEPGTGDVAPGGPTAPAWALALLLVGNGIVVPIAEELAWRGVIQTALVEAYGTYVAVVVTALAFVGKHLVVDLAADPFRVASLLVLAFVLCGLRARWGTASSAVAHLGANLLATASLVLV